MSRISLFAGLAAATLAFAFPSVGQAAVIGNLQIGVQNELEDDDYESLVNSGGTVSSPGAGTTVDVDDFLVGVVRITNFPTSGFDPGDTFGDPTITTLFASKVATKTGNLVDGFEFTFTNPTIAEWTALGMPAIPENEGVFAIMYDDPDNINESLDDLSGVLATANGTKLYEFGFDGDPATRWEAETDTDDVGSVAGFTGGFGNFQAGLNVIEQFAGPELIPMPASQFFFGAVGDIQLAITNGGLRGPGSNVGDGIDVQSDADFTLHPVPEPTSLAIFSLFGVAGVAARRRRNKK